MAGDRETAPRQTARKAASLAGVIPGCSSRSVQGVELERYERPLLILPDRCRNESVPDDFAHQAGDQLGSVVCATLPDESGDGDCSELRPPARMAPVEMDEELSSMGSQSQGVSLPGKLDRAG